jgi:hypothetical protein
MPEMQEAEGWKLDRLIFGTTWELGAPTGAISAETPRN